MGVHWVVQEGYLQCQLEGDGGHGGTVLHHRAALVERYFVLFMNRKMELFENSAKDPTQRMDACYVRAFCGWDGAGLLKAGESYGLELKLEKHAQPRMFVAAFNRLDLEKWCRGFVAVLDPESAAGQEVRRERRKARKEEKRAQEEKEEKIRMWKEQQRKMRDDEILRLQQREEEIQNMTPLERIDGLGSLDDDTARILEKRRQRLQRRQAPTTRRVNKAAYRQRLEDAAGGKLENVQPLQAKIVQEQRGKVRVEAPAPGQYIEAAGAAASRRNSNPARRRRLDSTDDSGSGSDLSSRNSRLSSGPFSSGSISGSIPPPPPQSEFDDSRSDYIPPPPPSIPGSRRESRSQSVRGSFYGEMERQSELSSSRLSVSYSSRQLSGAEREKQSAQANLAAILGGRKMPSRGDKSRNRRDSFESTADSTANGDIIPSSRTKTNGGAGDTSVTNAFAASLAAIRRNRADTMDESSNVDIPPSRRRDRKRDSQLSAEGKAILQKAISMDEPKPSAKKNGTANGGRKGLFDGSSSEDDSDAGLFGMRKSTARDARERPSVVNERPSTSKNGRRGADHRYAESASSDDEGSHVGVFNQPAPSIYSSPRSPNSPVSVARGNFYSQPKSLDVVYKSGVLENRGKKATAVYTFAFRSGNTEHSFSRSYHEFDEIHGRLKRENLPGLPSFPSKHLLRDSTKPENMQKRAMEFVQYFQRLVAIPGIFNNKRFQFEFEMSDDFMRTVLGGGSAGAASSLLTPTPTRTPKPSRAVNAVASNGGKSRATALFGADDTDSDTESVSIPMSTPRKPIQPAPETEPKKKKTSKPSRKDFDDEVEQVPQVPPSARRDRTRSRNSVKSVVEAKPGEPSAPKITGLPARPNLFGGGRGDLLAAIRQGAALKKVDGEDAAPLVPAGRGAGFPAPSSAPPPPPPPPSAPLTNAGSVAEAISNAMAARRIHVEYEDKSDDDSDDDWD